MKYQVGFSRGSSQPPFVHFEDNSPFPAIARGDVVLLTGATWEVVAIIHRFEIDPSSQHWAVTMAVVKPSSSHVDDFVPWPW